MTDNVEFWVVNDAGETVLLIEERRLCPVHDTPLSDDSTCDPCGGLNWTEWD